MEIRVQSVQSVFLIQGDVAVLLWAIVLNFAISDEEQVNAKFLQVNTNVAIKLFASKYKCCNQSFYKYQVLTIWGSAI
jgi:hypothetical protein